ncbi:MAG: CPBP family intramembrane glutamic endopeptidase [Anaerolineae bacterium]
MTAAIAYLTYRSAQLLREIEVPFNLMLSPVENGFRLLLILLCLALGWLSGLPPARLGWAVQSPATDILIGLVLGTAIQSVLHPVTHWAVTRFGKQVYSPVVMLNILPETRREWVLVPLALAPAALVEELLFRSLLLGGLSVLWPAMILAIGGSLLFGVMHAPQGPLGIAATGVVGFVLSLVFLWRGTLLSVFVMHYSINVMQLLRASWEQEWMQQHWAS